MDRDNKIDQNLWNKGYLSSRITNTSYIKISINHKRKYYDIMDNDQQIHQFHSSQISMALNWSSHSKAASIFKDFVMSVFSKPFKTICLLLCIYLIGQKFVGQNCRNFDLVSKILSVENFVQYFHTKVRQKSDKSVEVFAWCQKCSPTKYLFPRNFGR